MIGGVPAGIRTQHLLNTIRVLLLCNPLSDTYCCTVTLTFLSVILTEFSSDKIITEHCKGVI
jgi:hypothetical protein